MELPDQNEELKPEEEILLMNESMKFCFEVVLPAVRVLSSLVLLDTKLLYSTTDTTHH